MKKTTKITKKTKDGKIKIIITEIKTNKKLRAILISSIAAVLCIAIALIAIFYKPMHPIEKFALKLLANRNFQMEVSISDIPFLGSISFVAEMDGSVIHIPDVLSGEESYIEKVGGETFEYTKDETGKWVKSKSEDDPTLDLLNEDDLMELIDSNNYYLVEGTKNVYRQKDDVRFEKFKDVTITLEEDSCKIDMIAYVEVSIFGEMALTTHIVISNIGEMNVKLPSVA